MKQFLGSRFVFEIAGCTYMYSDLSASFCYTVWGKSFHKLFDYEYM